jgi:hypothetical protein
MRRLPRVTAGFAVLFLLAGCNVASRIVVQPDGSGSYSVILTLPNAKSNPGKALYTAMSEGAAKANIPLQVTPYSAGGSSGAKTTFNFRSLADLNAESKRLAASGNGAIGVTINRDTTGWHFAATTANSLVTPPGSASPGSPTGGSTGGPISSDQLGSLICIFITVQLPGVPAETNATAVIHTATTSTFNWALAPGQSATALQASTTFVGSQGSVKLASALTLVSPTNSASGTGGTGSSTGTLLYAGIGVVVIVAAGGVFILMRRRRTPPSPE